MSRSFFHHSRIVSLLTLASRVTGLVRDVTLAAWLGNTWIQDCFTYAFAIPHLFRRLFGEGALSSAFIPVFSGRLSKDRASARRLVEVVATVLALVLVAVTVLLCSVLWWLMHIGEAGADRQLLLGLTAVMAPYMVFVCLVALFSSVLNCLDRFALPAFMPIVLNLFQIAAVMIAWQGLSGRAAEQRIYWVAVAVLLAGVTQLAVMMVAVKRVGFTWRLRLRPANVPANPSAQDSAHDSAHVSPTCVDQGHVADDDEAGDLRQIVRMMLPMVVGLGILQVGAWLDNHIIVSLTATEPGQAFSLFGRTVAYPFGEGTMSAMNQARRLYQLPLGVLGIALATVAFPSFSRLAAENDRQGLGHSATRALRMALFEALPCGVGLWVLSDLIVSVIFEHGQVTAVQAAQAGHILRCYSVGLWAFFAHQVIMRVYYSMKDTVSPLRVMGRTLVLGIVLSVVLLWWPPLRAGAFGIGTSVMMAVNVVVLGRRLERVLPSFAIVRVLRAVGPMLVASAVMGGTLWLVRRWLPIENRYLLLGATMLVGAVVFFAVAHLLRIRESREFLSLFRHRTR